MVFPIREANMRIILPESFLKIYLVLVEPILPLESPSLFSLMKFSSGLDHILGEIGLVLGLGKTEAR